MSSEQYSPLDTTLPFFSNQVSGIVFTSEFSGIQDLIIPFLLKFKGIARRIRVSTPTLQGAVRVYFDGDLDNPYIMGTKETQTFTRWTKSVRINYTATPQVSVLVEYDVVPVQYLPPRTRVG